MFYVVSFFFVLVLAQESQERRLDAVMRAAEQGGDAQSAKPKYASILILLCVRLCEQSVRSAYE